jgi:[protein-PII] uridylyltransferase
VRLLGAGPGLLPVWETLDETGALDRLLPEWDRVRLLPHATLLHRFTVDRHLVETCVEASRLMRRVHRPDLLLVAGLLHDLGKAGVGDHSAVGAPLAASLARRTGFSDADAETVGALVRWHLLLGETATTRDLEDPATLEHVRVRVPDRPRLELLAALTEADARATSAQAWTTWRAGLVQELVRRVDAALEERPGPVDPPAPEPAPEMVEELVADSSRADVRVERQGHGTEVTVACADRPGALAAVAGALALMRVPVRAARAWNDAGVAVSRWQVADEHLDAAVLRTQVEAVLAGRRDPTARFAAARAPSDPVVVVRPEASRRATVLEVRVEDRPGLVHLVTRTLSDLEVAVCSAHVTTIGPLAVDVFYLQEEGAGALSDVRAAHAAHAVRAAVAGPATLDA